MSDGILAWHWLPDDRRLAHPLPDGSRPEARPGLVLEVPPPIVLCDRGLHASRRALDALNYAAGAYCCRVRCSGEIVERGDKLACARREVIACADAAALLHHLACDVAEYALDKYGGTVDPRSREAIAVKRSWLSGKTTDADLSAARAAAEPAAWSARSAAESARSAAESAWSAAWAEPAAWSAAESARSAAESAARSAAWSDINRVFEERLRALLGCEL